MDRLERTHSSFVLDGGVNVRREIQIEMKEEDCKINAIKGED